MLSASALVKSAQYQQLYTPNATDPDLALISAEQAWAQRPGGAADAGRGVHGFGHVLDQLTDFVVDDGHRRSLGMQPGIGVAEDG